MIIIDGNGVVVLVVFCISEVIVIYFIIFSFMMVEQVDVWVGNGLKNVWGDILCVVEMQLEVGVIVIVYGVLQMGVFLILFTLLQGLLLMILMLYKLVGELILFVLYVVVCIVVIYVFFIFGDYFDVMVVRQMGCVMLCVVNVQEV